MPPSATYTLEIQFMNENDEETMVRLDIASMPQLKIGEKFSIIKGKKTDRPEFHTELIDIYNIAYGTIVEIKHQLIQCYTSDTVYVWTLFTYVRLSKDA